MIVLTVIGVTLWLVLMASYVVLAVRMGREIKSDRDD